MTDTTTAIDLSQLTAPTVVETLDYATIRAAVVADIITDIPTLDAADKANPAVKVLEVYAYREVLIRQDFNERCKQVMLAYATGSNLDQLGALLNVARNAGEEDDAYRARIQLAPYSFSVAGPATAYKYWALSADSTIADVSVTTPKPDDMRALVLGVLADHAASADLVAAMTSTLDSATWPGTVVVTLLSATGDGTASDAQIEAVEAELSEDVVPLTDLPQVQSAAMVDYTIDIDLTLFDGPDSTVVLTAAQEAVEAYKTTSRKLGRDITRAGLYRAAMADGAQNAVINSPPADVVISATQCGNCVGTNVKVAGRGD